MDKRKEMIDEIKSRLEHASDSELKKLHKATRPVSREDVAEDIIKYSEKIRPDGGRRF